jgi:hypothetical protein
MGIRVYTPYPYVKRTRAVRGRRARRNVSAHLRDLAGGQQRSNGAGHGLEHCGRDVGGVLGAMLMPMRRVEAPPMETCDGITCSCS